MTVLPRLCLLAAVCAVVPASASAQSVGVFRTATGARAAALAGADLALGTTPLEALTFNPAGLTDVETRTLGLTLSAASANGDFSNRVDPAGGLEGARGLIPEGALAWRVKGRPVVVGAAFGVDGAIGGDWVYRDAPGVAGATYGVQTNRSAIRVARASVGAGVRLAKAVSVGAAIAALRNDNELVAPYIFQSQAPVVGLKTLLSVETGGWGLSGTAGITARVSEAVMVGASYRTPTSVTTSGSASGDIGTQLSSLGLVAPGAFTYSARVANRFPQQASVSSRVRVSPRLQVMGQVDWWDWSRAFSELAITLENGSNGVINSVVGGSTIVERVPLRWRDQVVRRLGAEYAWGQAVRLRGGYAYGGHVVPDDTLTPMTAAIITHTAGVGLGVDLASGTVDVALQVSPAATRSVTRSRLAGSGEYDGTTTRVGLRALSLSWSRRF
jgi:long-subunit fatty acid transport protein